MPWDSSHGVEIATHRLGARRARGPSLDNTAPMCDNRGQEAVDSTRRSAMAESAPPSAPAPQEPTTGRRVWAILRQPRIVLILLAGWSVVGAVTEFFSNSGLFLELH